MYTAYLQVQIDILREELTLACSLPCFCPPCAASGASLIRVSESEACFLTLKEREKSVRIHGPRASSLHLQQIDVAVFRKRSQLRSP